MNWKFILFLSVLGIVTFIGGYQYEILNYHHNDVSTWALRVAIFALCLFGIFISMINLIANRKGLPVIVTLFVIMLSWAAALYAGHVINKNRSALTREHADQIIRASYNYYADLHKFPETLKDLSPKYLPELPTIALGNGDASFEFYSSKDHFSITYEDIKGRAKRYDSGKKTWEVLDRSFE